MTISLRAIRILRWLPHSARVDRHLDRCAALAVLYAPFGDNVKPLRLAHVLGLIPLPGFLPGEVEVSGVRVDSVFSDYNLGSDSTPVILDRSDFIKG